jgi:hypothetical protein
MRIALLTAAAVVLIPSLAGAQSTFGTIFPNSSQGTYRAGTIPQKGKSYVAPRSSTYAPLTSQECQGLGGKVSVSLRCKSSGFACTTVDRNGVVRTQCLTKMPF